MLGLRAAGGARLSPLVLLPAVRAQAVTSRHRPQHAARAMQHQPQRGIEPRIFRLSKPSSATELWRRSRNLCPECHPTRCRGQRIPGRRGQRVPGRRGHAVPDSRGQAVPGSRGHDSSNRKHQLSQSKCNSRGNANPGKQNSERIERGYTHASTNNYCGTMRDAR